jgi:hypothetical protein
MADFNSDDYAQPSTYVDPNQQFVDAWQEDPHAMHVATSAHLYGTEYAAQEAAALGREDLVNALGYELAQPEPQQPEDPYAGLSPELRQAHEEYDAHQADANYLQARGAWLAQPGHEGWDPELFDRAVAVSETWEQADDTYQHLVSRFGQPTQAPPTLGPTPSVPEGQSYYFDQAGRAHNIRPTSGNSLDAAIDEMFKR